MIADIAIGLGGWTLLSIIVGLGLGRWLRRCSQPAGRSSTVVRPFRKRVA